MIKSDFLFWGTKERKPNDVVVEKQKRGMAATTRAGIDGILYS